MFLGGFFESSSLENSLRSTWHRLKFKKKGCNALPDSLVCGMAFGQD